MAYTIEFTSSAERAFRRLSRQVQARLAPAIDALATAPRSGDVKKLAGDGDLYRKRVGSYRIIYRIEDRRLIVLVVDVGDRRDIYRRLR